MKKLFLIFTLSTITITVSLLSLANLNVVNLLFSGTDYGSGAMEAYNTKSNSKDDRDSGVYLESTSDSTLETLQSGLIGSGGSGGSLNLMWLLQNAGSPNKESYAYQLLNAYAKLEAGAFNNYPLHISPEAVAGSHYNETGLKTFVAPNVEGYGKVKSGIFGKTVNGKVITLENAVKADIMTAGNAGGSVWKDANSDGCPDGPLQIIQCNQSDANANKLRTDKKYDLYSFVDAMNVIDGKYNVIAGEYKAKGLNPNPSTLLMLSGLFHNRGESGLIRMAFGFPYNPNSGGNYSKGMLKRNDAFSKLNANDLDVVVSLPRDLIKWFDKSNIPLENVVQGNTGGTGMATMLALANGGFIDMPLMRHTISGITSQKDSTISALFPGQTKSTIVAHINANYVKKPWDVLKMSQSEYNKIYNPAGLGNYGIPYGNKYERNTVFHIDPTQKSDNYISGTQQVVRNMEGIAIGYMFDTGVRGPFTILKIALEAGIKSLTDGTVVDPSNPQVLYKKMNTGDSDTYTPAGAAEGNYGKFLDGLGLTGKLTVTQQAQIGAMYQYAGGPYSQGSRGTLAKNGLYYWDCSSFASVGLNLGLGKPISSTFVTTASVNSGVWLKSTKMTNPVEGKTYPAKVVQLDKNGNPLPASTSVNNSHLRKDGAWLPYLKTGDMVNGRGSNGGHIFTYLGKNTTDKNMVLTQDVSKAGAKFSVYKPGQHFTMQAAYYAHTFDSGKMGLMPLMEDTSGAQYHAMRPVYNLQ